MRLRSALFVPGDRPERMRKALSSGADGVVLDLEDSVARSGKPEARRHVAAFLREAGRSGPALFVRINALDAGMLDGDLAVVREGEPFGVVLPKAGGGDDVRRLDAALAGSVAAILPVVTETPAAVFATGTYGGASDRLFALTWGAEDLSAALGASTARETDGAYRSPYQLARSLTLFGAHAAGVPALETIFPDVGDAAGLARYAARAREDGFCGMFAIHPTQVAVINDAFRPSERELAHARRIIDLFATACAQGAFMLDGQMVDAPHLAQARKLLGLDS